MNSIQTWLIIGILFAIAHDTAKMADTDGAAVPGIASSLVFCWVGVLVGREIFG